MCVLESYHFFLVNLRFVLLHNSLPLAHVIYSIAYQGAFNIVLFYKESYRQNIEILCIIGIVLKFCIVDIFVGILMITINTQKVFPQIIVPISSRTGNFG